MFVAHLPAGYLAGSLIAERWRPVGLTRQALLTAGMLGAIAPDFDLLYFYFVDARQTHHHQYWTHLPLLWLGLLALTLGWLAQSTSKTRATLALVFVLNGILHLLLDTLVGDIWWLYPWRDQPFALFTVPALHQPWWLNFVLHWSFALELLILGAALAHAYRRRRAAIVSA